MGYYWEKAGTHKVEPKTISDIEEINQHIVFHYKKLFLDNGQKNLFACRLPDDMIPSKSQIEYYASKINTKKSQGSDLIPLSIIKS